MPNTPADYTPSLSDYTEYPETSPFLMCCMENFPFIEEDFDSLTYYEMLCKIVDHINKFIVHLNTTESNIEAMETNINSLLTAYNELQSYVNNYFQNLDVQQEINNKLDEMATSGTLLNIIRQTVIDTTNTYLTDNLDGVLEPIVDTKLPSLVDTKLPAIVDVKLPPIMDQLIMSYNLYKFYNTHELMIQDSQNFVKGNKFKTLGYYNIGDWGNASYIVTDVENTHRYQEKIVGKNLWIEMLVPDSRTYNLEQFGAKTYVEDENYDCTPIIKYIMEHHPDNVSTIHLYSRRGIFNYKSTFVISKIYLHMMHLRLEVPIEMENILTGLFDCHFIFYPAKSSVPSSMFKTIAVRNVSTSTSYINLCNFSITSINNVPDLFTLCELQTEVIIDDCRFSDSSNIDRSSILLNISASNIHVRNSRFINGKDGIFIEENSNSNLITDCTFSNQNHLAVDVDGSYNIISETLINGTNEASTYFDVAPNAKFNRIRATSKSSANAIYSLN